MTGLPGLNPGAHRGFDDRGGEAFRVVFLNEVMALQRAVQRIALGTGHARAEFRIATACDRIPVGKGAGEWFLVY